MGISFQEFLWIIAGAEPSILKNCKTDYKKYSSIGATILMTSFIAFCAGTCAAWYFTQDGDNKNGEIWWAIIFGLIWALLIFCIDRSLVITLKKDPTKKRQKIWIPLLSRAALACIIAFMVSIPLELFIFKDYINENIENFKEVKGTQLGDLIKSNSNEDFYKIEVENTGNKLKRLNANDSLISHRIDSVQALLNKINSKINNPDSEDYRSAQRRYDDASENLENVEAKIRSAKQNPDQSVITALKEDSTEYANNEREALKEIETAKTNWENQMLPQKEYLDSIITELKNEKKENNESRKTVNDENTQYSQAYIKSANAREKSEELKKEQMEKGNKFLLNFQILEYAVWQRDKDGNLTDITQLCFLWLIRFLFFIIELLPTVVKIVTPVGSYDRVVYAQEKSMKEYLGSPEFLDSMREIHKSELQTQLEEAKLRQEAEIQMQKDILEKMTSAQVDVASVAIAKWLEREKRKFSRDGLSVPPPPPPNRQASYSALTNKNQTKNNGHNIIK